MSSDHRHKPLISLPSSLTIARLRRSYAASDELSRKVSDAWQAVDTDNWPADRLD